MEKKGDMSFSFLPSEVKFFDYFERASANLLEGAVILKKLLDDFHNIEEIEGQVTEIEHKGDFIVHEVTNLLPRTLITPIDSDDIQRLIFSIDDALDTLHAAIMRLSIYKVTDVKKPAKRLAGLIVEGATELDQAIKMLRDKKNYDHIRERIVQINTIENNGDRVLEDGLRNLVEKREDLFEFICWKEIYELLEQTTDRLEDAGDVIQRVLVTNA
jgi:predicted phosphate transport protein (TIGR00153 family)